MRSGWRNARWPGADGAPVSLLTEFENADASGQIDRPIWIGRKSGPALALRLVAIKKPPQAAEAARRAARRAAREGGHTISEGTLIAAEWVILVTSLPAGTFSTEDILALYRLRWRIELAFKRLKSLIGLKAPPGVDAALRQALCAGPSFGHPFARTADRRVRGLSPLGCRRLTRPGAWRLLLQLTATLLQAIMPQPSLAGLRRAKNKLRRHLHEPPRRKREYQRMARLFLRLWDIGRGAAAAAMRGFADDKQLAHFGPAGEDFAIVRRLPYVARDRVIEDRGRSSTVEFAG